MRGREREREKEMAKGWRKYGRNTRGGIDEKEEWRKTRREEKRDGG